MTISGKAGICALVLLVAACAPERPAPVPAGTDEAATSAAPPVYTTVNTGVHIDSGGGVNVGVGVGIHRGPVSIWLGF